MHEHLMNDEIELAATAGCTNHAVGNRAEILSRIRVPGVNLSLWQRPTRPTVSRELSSLQVSDLPDVRCSTTLTTFESDLTRLLELQGLDPSALSHWRKDLRRLAGTYFAVSDDRDVTLRLVTTDDDDCRRYHVDRTQLRMLCTYLGPGTEWLSNDQVDRLAQASGSPNEEIIRFGEPARFEPFWVGILKGDAYPGNSGNGLVHRSPPITGSGQTRVLFCLDC